MTHDCLRFLKVPNSRLVLRAGSICYIITISGVLVYIILHNSETYISLSCTPNWIKSARTSKPRRKYVKSFRFWQSDQKNIDGLLDEWVGLFVRLELEIIFDCSGNGAECELCGMCCFWTRFWQTKMGLGWGETGVISGESTIRISRHMISD